MNTRLVYVSLGVVVCLTRGLFVSAQSDVDVSTTARTESRFQDQIVPFLETYCKSCHGIGKAEPALTLAELSSDDKVNSQNWRGVLAKLDNREMPPLGADQPSAIDREATSQWIKEQLNKVGESWDSSARNAPVRGNHVDHELLFSGRDFGPAYTPARLWRVSAAAYEEFMYGKIRQFKLGIRSYGSERIRSPWQLPYSREFSDYASEHRVGDADIEFHIRNATQLARAMVTRFARRPSAAVHSDSIPGIHQVITVGKSASTPSLRVAVTQSFERILGRSASRDETERFAEFLGQCLRDLEPERAVEQFLVAVLLHPDVLYRVELPQDRVAREIMPPLALARAIALTLTDQLPDVQLHAAARTAWFSEPAKVRQEVHRILYDNAIPKPRLVGFFREYFGYATAGEVFKDPKTLNSAGIRKQAWDAEIFVSDADRVVEWALSADTQVLRTLLTTPMTFIASGDSKEAARFRQKRQPKFPNSVRTTLEIYEIDLAADAWSANRPYEMPGDHRIGILTHPSWLIAHSANFDNQPIQRGRWIRERLLGGAIPDLPVSVNAMVPDEPHSTLRQRLRVTTDDYCWNCHRLMDPLGLPFENYDHLGRFRLTELNSLVDTSGEILESGEPELDGRVRNPRELIERLARSNRVEQVFVRHVFRYFLGRNETLQDGPTLVAAHNAYTSSEGSMNALLLSLLTSDSFLYRSTHTITGSR